MKDKIKKVLTKHGVLYKQDEIVEDIYNSLLIPVDKDNLPEHDVIAFNEKWAIIGKLFKEKMFDLIGCENEESGLLNITHYMGIPKLK